MPFDNFRKFCGVRKKIVGGTKIFRIFFWGGTKNFRKYFWGVRKMFEKKSSCPLPSKNGRPLTLYPLPFTLITFMNGNEVTGVFLIFSLTLKFRNNFVQVWTIQHSMFAGSGGFFWKVIVRSLLIHSFL